MANRRESDVARDRAENEIDRRNHRAAFVGVKGESAPGTRRCDPWLRFQTCHGHVRMRTRLPTCPPHADPISMCAGRPRITRDGSVAHSPYRNYAPLA